jgi:hypothetical protein
MDIKTDLVVFRDAHWSNPNAPLPPVAERPVGIQRRFELEPGLFIVRIGGELSHRISSAVNAGAAPDATVDTYTLIRERVSEVEDWDPDGRLQLVVGLSRLVHPTSIALEQSATLFGRITDPPNSLAIRPGPVSGPAATAYVTDTATRNWLTEDDATQLRGMLAAYDAAPLPPRLGRALWFHEFASRTMDAAVRWALFVTGLESLVNVRTDRAVKQFVTRTTAFAADLEMSFTKKDATRAYANRSKVSHGAVTSLPSGDLALLIALERLLRTALRKGILDREFAMLLADDNRIESTWPVLPS